MIEPCFCRDRIRLIGLQPFCLLYNVEFQWYHYAACLLAGLLAGIINTLAGSGSLITLPILMFLGLPATIANGTNRVGAIATSVIGAKTFLKKEKLPRHNLYWIIIPALVGAILGASIAVDINEEVLYKIIGFVMLIMLVVILIRPKRFLKIDHSSKSNTSRALLVLWMFVLGIYGGFIQAGIGIFLIVTFVLLINVTLNQANLLKLILVLIFTIPVLFIFILHDQVDWVFGILLAFGQGVGAWLAARFATNYANADIWVRRLLIIIVVLSILKLFNIPESLGL